MVKLLLDKIFGTLEDISAQIETEVAITEKENLINALIDNLPTTIYIKDKSFRKTLVNESERIFYDAKTKEELLGKDDIELLGEEMGNLSMEDERAIFKNKKPILNKEEVLTTKNGKTTHLLTSKIPLFDDFGEVDSILGIGTDITALKDKEEDLKNLISITSVQNKKLLDFAHIISHNLRSHTANFSMLLDFLITEKDEAEKRNIIKMLISSSNGLSETLTNLNDVINLRDNTKLQVAPVNIYNQLEVILENLTPFITKHKAIITKKIPENLTVLAVDEYLDSILINLITNAIHYRHPERTPSITLKTSEINGKTVLSVIDNGLGLDLSKHGKKLFGMYKTFHDNPNAKGIGLYINRNQAEAMNCTIEVESEVDKGSVFSIVFNE